MQSSQVLGVAEEGGEIWVARLSSSKDILEETGQTIDRKEMHQGQRVYSALDVIGNALDLDYGRSSLHSPYTTHQDFDFPIEAIHSGNRSVCPSFHT